MYGILQRVFSSDHPLTHVVGETLSLGSRLKQASIIIRAVHRLSVNTFHGETCFIHSLIMIRPNEDTASFIKIKGRVYLPCLAAEPPCRLDKYNQAGLVVPACYKISQNKTFLCEN